MSTEIKNEYQDIPTPELVSAVSSRALEVAGGGVEDINFSEVGFYMTTYGYLFVAGPLSQPDALERLPMKALDSLVTVAEACAIVVETSQQDPVPFDLAFITPRENPETGEEYVDIGQLFTGLQIALQGTKMPEPRTREVMIKDEVEAIATGKDTDESGYPLYVITGPTNASMKAVRELVLVAGREFGSVYSGCELIAEEDDTRFTGIIPNIARMVSANWKNPDWIPFKHNDTEVL